jgi:nucleotide-binding universal stress UspA family protein
MAANPAKEEKAMKTIVIGYDDTEPAKRALARAADLGEAFGATLVVTSVATVVVPAGHGAGGIDPTDPPERHEEELAHAREYLATRNVTAEYVNAIGEPDDAIIAAAEEHRADLIVVGTRELGFAQRLLGQSVSLSVAGHAHTDVLIVH